MVGLSSLVCTWETGWSPCVGCTVDWLILGWREEGRGEREVERRGAAWLPVLWSNRFKCGLLEC